MRVRVCVYAHAGVCVPRAYWVHCGTAGLRQATRSAVLARDRPAVPPTLDLPVLLHALHARHPLHWAASTALVSSWRAQLFSALAGPGAAPHEPGSPGWKRLRAERMAVGRPNPRPPPPQPPAPYGSLQPCSLADLQPCRLALTGDGCARTAWPGRPGPRPRACRAVLRAAVPWPCLQPPGLTWRGVTRWSPLDAPLQRRARSVVRPLARHRRPLCSPPRRSWKGWASSPRTWPRVSGWRLGSWVVGCMVGEVDGGWLAGWFARGAWAPDEL